MKRIKMIHSKRVAGAHCQAGKSYDVSDPDASVLIRMKAAELVKDLGADATPDSERRAAAKAKKAAKKSPAKSGEKAKAGDAGGGDPKAGDAGDDNQAGDAGDDNQAGDAGKSGGEAAGTQESMI